LNVLAKLLVPDEILNDFEVEDAFEQQGCWIITLVEKHDLSHIPKQIKYKSKARLNGYCNSIDIQTFPTGGKEVYLRLYRRKWKTQDGKQSYYNHYDYVLPGMKATKKFAVFLKEINRG